MANVTVVIRVKDGEIVKEPRWHPETFVLPGDTVSWTCEGAAFQVEGFEVDACKKENCIHIRNPFRRQISGDIFANGETILSTKVVPAASGHTYKATWKIYQDENSREPLHRLDPHIYVGP